ncbi:ATP-binding cassette domain-containing protein [Sandaracinus amylolyticus]|uniref:ATP-binding cassette domain-containing protein n=1 Tax=Sandaracinus amylolyticus TaxID=927083 RepID=UPI00069F530A|nr:ATP-binding cassette domain-containing protein [Sandaracinus amylolyticus]
MSLRARIEAQVGRLAIDVELDTGPGVLAIVGPNGAGKTTLLSLLLGVLPVTRGRIEVNGVVLLDTSASVNAPVEARRLGYAPQDHALFPHLDVRGNVELAVSSALARAERARRIDEVLRDLQIEHLASRRPSTLSGGERQRVALARALSISPRALLLDEPLAALDARARREVRDFLATTLGALAIPSIVVTHDAAEARALGQRIAVMEAGRVVQQGTWDELVAAPATPFVRELAAHA